MNYLSKVFPNSPFGEYVRLAILLKKNKDDRVLEKKFKKFRKTCEDILLF